MSEKIYEVPPFWAKRALVDSAGYDAMYERSIADNEGFWNEHGKRIDWMTPYTKVKSVSYAPGAVSIKWFEDGATNVAHNCIDRHLEKRGDQVAIIWEGTTPKTPDRSPTRSFISKSRPSPTCSRRMASKRVTGSRSTCR